MKKITFLFLLAFPFFTISSYAQTYFSDNFSDLDISDWTIYDADGDSYSWTVDDWSLGGNLQEFTESLASRSWISGVGGLNPDNYIVSPAIDLSTANTGVQLEYLYGTPQGDPYHDETYSVYVVNSNSLAALQSATALHTETLSIPSSSQTNVINLDAFIGQTVYVAFRHHNTFDENLMVVDDVEVRTPLSVDAILSGISLDRYALTSVDSQLSFEVFNDGLSTITSLDVIWSDGTNNYPETVNVNMAPGDTVTLNHSTFVNYATPEEKTITVTINAVNGATDGDTSNNSLSTLFNTVSQAGTKHVLVEQQTGTWCGWCPRGKVGMEYINTTYPNAMLVEVHGAGGDPMEDLAYASALQGLVGGSYPNASVDRNIATDPGQSTLQVAYDNVASDIVPADLTSSATLSGSTLTINLSATFYSNFSSANFRFAGIITEDNVMGTTSAFDQANYYSGGASGPMGGYESLPNPIPASQIEYDHVGRAMLGGFEGETGSVPSTISDGNVVSHTFTYNIPTSSDQNNMHIIGLLIDQTSGSVVNGFQQTVNQALSVADNNVLTGVSIFPNPTNDKLGIAINKASGDYDVSVFDLLGRQVISSSYQNLSGNEIELPLNPLNSGQYILRVTNNENSFVTKFIKQ